MITKTMITETVITETVITETPHTDRLLRMRRVSLDGQQNDSLTTVGGLAK